jgi:tetratricopeptide (TPR) repeat protein
MQQHFSVSALIAALVATLVGGCTSADMKAQRRFERGNEYVANGDYAHAIIEYRSALQDNANFGQARYRLALAYEKTGDLRRAVPEAGRAADLLPEAAEVQLTAGGMLMLTGAFEDAAARAQRVLERDPANMKAFMLLGNASAHVKQSDTARATLEEAIKQLPSEPVLQQSLGVFEAGQGNNQAAEAAFKRAIEIAPTSIAAREALANYYWSINKREDAERTFKESLPLDSSGTVTRDLAAFYFRQGRKEAEPFLVKLVHDSPKDPAARVALGDLYAKQRRFDEALKAYAPLAGDPGTFAMGATRIASTEHAAGRKEQAHNRLKEALKHAPKDADMHTMSARLLLADQRFEESEAAARAVLRITPDRFEALYVLGSAILEQNREKEAFPILQQAAAIAPNAIGPKLQLAHLHLNRGDVTTAVQLAREAVKIDPNQPLARIILVRALLAQHNVPSAEEGLTPLLQAFSNSPEVQVAAGDLALLKNDRDAARRAYVRARELSPESVEALTGLVVLNLLSQRSQEALSLVNTSLAAHSGDARVLMVAARTYIATKDAKQAELMLQRVIKITPASLEAYGLLAALYFNQHRLDEAKAQFEVMATSQRAAVGPTTMLGIILQLQGKPKEAQTEYERLLQTHPDAAIAANNLAMLLMETGGNLDMALNYAQSAKKALADDPNISDTLGLVYYKKGLASLAVTAFEQSTQGQPANPEFWLHLGQAYAAAGNKVKARDALQRALKLNPQFGGAPIAVKALDDLNKRV